MSSSIQSIFIDNAFRDGSTRASLPVVNPATEDVIAHISAGTASDVNDAVG
jgi:acyl-CoA reductase-like NAD-dependent aldehyde dehydrogenase